MASFQYFQGTVWCQIFVALNFCKSHDILVNQNFVRKIFVIACTAVFVKCKWMSTEGYFIAQSSERTMKRPGEVQFHLCVRGYHAYNDGWSLAQHHLPMQNRKCPRPVFAAKVVKSLAITSSTCPIIYSSFFDL